MSAVALGLLGGVVNGIFNSANNAQNRRHEMMLNLSNQHFQKQMWDLNNEYNTPANQMKRLEEAGINPHMAYSNGSPMNVSNAPVQAPPSVYSPSEANRLDVQGLLNSISMSKDIEMKDAQIEQIKAQTDNTREQTVGLNIDNVYKPSLNDSVLSTSEVQQKLSLSNIEVNEQSILESESRILNNAKTREYLDAQIDLSNAQKNLAVKALSVMEATIRNLASQTYLNYKSASNVEANTRHINEMVKNAQRGNYIGEKFDLSNASAESKMKMLEASNYAEKLLLQNGFTREQIRQLKLNSNWINIEKALGVGSQSVDLFYKPIEKNSSILGNIFPFGKK